MKRIYLILLALVISSATFAAGWIETFSGGVGDPETDGWYGTTDTVTTTSPFFGTTVTVYRGWNANANWNWQPKPAGTFAYFNGAQAVRTFSLVSPAFTPAAGTSTLYFEIQEVKVASYPAPTSDGEQIFFEVSTNGGETWTASTENILASLTGHNVSTTSTTVLTKDLSAYAGQSIKIRFRGITDNGPFATVLYKVALVDTNAATVDLAVTTSAVTPQIPLKQANQALNATVQNLGKAVTAGEAKVKITSTGGDYTYSSTVDVPALAPLQSVNLTFTTPFAPTAYGNYSLTYELQKADGTALTDVTSNTFALTPGVFSTVADGIVSTGSGNTSSTFGYKFTLGEADVIESLSVAWGTAYTPSAPGFKVYIYSVDPETNAVESTPVYTSEEFQRPGIAAAPNNVAANFINYRFATPQSLAAGTYFFGIKQTTNSGSGTIGIGAGYVTGGGYYQFDQGTTALAYNNSGSNLYIRVNTQLEGLTLNPLPGATNVAANGAVVVEFGSAIPISTITVADRTKITLNGVPVSEPLLAVPGRIAARIPHPNFTEYEYTVNIPAGTIAGFDRLLSWTFTTRNTPTAIAPVETDAVSPADAATGILIDTPISIKFDKSVSTNGAPVLDNIYIKTSTGQLIKNVVATVDETDSGIINIAHDNLGYNTAYTVVIPKGTVKGYDSDYTWSFTTIVALARVSTSITSYDINIPVDAEVSIVYNRAFTIADASKIKINTIAVDADNLEVTGNTLKINHAPFAYNTDYAIRIETGTFTEALNTWTLSFTTEKAVIAVTDTVPANNATDVAINAPVSITFDKAVNINGAPDYTKISVFETDDPASKADGVAPAIDAENPNKLNIIHDDLRTYKNYTVQLAVGAIAGIDEVVSWSFMTVPATITVLADGGLTPANGATGVALNADVKVNFDKRSSFNADPDFTGVTIKDAAGNAVAEVVATQDIASGFPPMQLPSITIAHADLAYNTEYTVTIPAGAIVGVAEAITWSFTTELASLRVDYTVPGEYDDNVALDAPVTVTFDKNIDSNGAPDLTGVTIKDASNNAVANVAATFEGKVLTIAHADFAYSTEYTVTIPANAIAGYAGYSWSFITRNQPLEVVTYVPAEDATDVALDTPITLEFNQNIFLRAYTGIGAAPSIKINGEDAVGLLDRESIEVPTNKLKITHENLAFAEETQYTVVITRYLQNQGDVITWAFTTGKTDGIDKIGISSSVYPVISKGSIKVTSAGNATIHVADLSGRNLASYQSTGVQEIHLNYTNGIYLISVDNGKTVSTYKVILKK
ncbi:MAG: Ig-like domain-containing protein [Candidatus Symbiothrix sp.]|jgi:hypothetical protein|nr:Ig-like domain-containing protein [Candidatus Symbiothrix sp.]